MKVAKTFSFDASHSLPNYPGKCVRPHGHTWRIEIVVQGKIDYDTGMVVDFKDLARVANDAMYRDDIDWDLDHNHLNILVPTPTAEILVRYIIRRLKTLWGEQKLPGSIVSLKLWEKYEVRESWVEIDWEEAYE